MVKNFGYVQLKNFDQATKNAKQGFAQIFSGTDFLQGGSPYYKHVVELLQPKKDQSLVDLGFGRGFFLRELEGKGMKLYGVDFCEGAKDAAAKVLNEAKLFVADLHDLPFKTGTFDFVTCLGVIEHLVHPEKGVHEISRVLKKEGLAILTIPNSVYASLNLSKQMVFFHTARMLHAIGLRKKIAVHVRQPIDRFYTPQEGKQLLEKNGLRVVYAELVKSKREHFSIFARFSQGKISPSLRVLNANFTLYVCKQQ